ncbi:MAG: GNAT family N-acetyltransferase [Bacteriovoracaceae bacterium]
MKLSNLKARPDKYKDTLALIERNFEYQSPNRFDIDFFPLMKEENRENCWIFLKNDQVVAHTGVLEKKFKINNQLFPVAFIGGVAVEENSRGNGLSARLLENIFSAYRRVSFFALWSDKVEMYKKSGFYPCIELFELAAKENAASSFQKTKLSELSPENIESLKKLYDSESEIRVFRTQKDWKVLKNVSSCDLYVKRNGEILSNYIFVNKGQDLKGVIHEYGHLKDKSEALAHGKLWTSQFQKEATALFGALVKPGVAENFKNFIQAFTHNRIRIHSIKGKIEEKIFFAFEGKDFALDTETFLQGVFGPGRFEELSDLPNLFIGGIDSV